MRLIKKKILFGITSLGLGGAERVLVDISNKLCEKYDITIFSIYDKGELKKELNKNIKFKSLYDCRYDELSKIQKMWIPIKILLFSKFIYNKKIKQDYDVEISFLEGPITRLFATKNNKTKKIAWIHNDIKRVFGSGIKSKLKRNIDKKIYTKYNDLVFVSNDNMEKFQEIYNDINTENMHVIYNYIDSELVIKKSKDYINFGNHFGQLDEKIFVTVCRLVKQKALDRLIKIHSKLIKNGYKHKFYIIGDGPEKENLKSLIDQENVKETFILLGKKENPYPYIKQADYFCLLSYFEGYGMVLEEAKILNKKIIITDTAARESLEGYKKGIILDNSEEGIYNGLLKIIKLDENNNEDINDEYQYDNNDKIQKIIDLVGE
ncbi:MAG: glycosyltransferase [Clostridia bacterium]|nr:glycosyltransferase [Clostridia bacterium]